ncbi:MAG: sulfotransferase [Bacteroidales bacterium]|nr:sulfotransferase [Bacteroidales bacterium]
MKVCILGVARSGTTAIYSLLQEIMLENLTSVDFVYEPFLWNTESFNSRFEEIGFNFKYNSSISIEGIYNHQKLPMFIGNPDKYKSNKYLNRLFHSNDPNKNMLVKLIKANGRYSLIREICPDCKMIFTLRNPIDSVYSIISKFSYYGGEFHKDDYSRFKNEVINKFKINLDQQNITAKIDKELAYWYYMNKFTLESFKDTGSRPLIICHEEYLNNRKDFIIQICKYLDYDYNPDYLTFSKKMKGAVTKMFNISQSELNVLSSYWDKYIQLLKENRIEFNVDLDTILNKYNIRNKKCIKENNYYGLSPLIIYHKVNEIESNNYAQSLVIAEKSHLIEESTNRIKYINEKLFDKQEQIDNYMNIIKGNDYLVEKWDKIIIEKNKTIHHLDMMVNAKENIIEEKDKTIQNIELVVKEKEEIIGQRDKVITDKNKTIQNIELVVKEKEEIIGQRDKVITEKNKAIQNLELVVEGKEDNISELILKLKDTSLSLDNKKDMLKQTSEKLELSLKEKNQNERKINEIYASASWKIGHNIISLIVKLFFWVPFFKKKFN